VGSARPISGLPEVGTIQAQIGNFNFPNNLICGFGSRLTNPCRQHPAKLAEAKKAAEKV
jgi:hypothetical protein